MSTNYPPPDGATDLAQPERSGGSGLKLALIGGGSVLGLAVVGVGAWAVYSFMSGGDQPAEALPGNAIAYASVDLDPSGAQKIEALRMLNKFPAFEDEVGLEEDDDIRAKMFEEMDCEGLSYEENVEPWLGTAFAVAAVDTGAEHPVPVAVMNVEDEGSAEENLPKLIECGGEGDQGAYRISDGWMTVAETDEILDEVEKLVEDGTLADSDHFQRWTDEAGDDGIATFYAGPEAGAWMLESLDMLTELNPMDSLAGVPEPGEAPWTLEEYCADDFMGSTMSPEDCEESYNTLYGADAEDPAASAESPEVPEQLRKQLEEFDGAAAVLRFADGGLELEMAVDAKAYGEVPAGAGDEVAALPATTFAAISFGVPEDYVANSFEQFSEITGMSAEELEQSVAASGLQIPEDLQTLLGDVVTLVLDGDISFEQIVNSGDPSGVPLGARLNGDADAIEDVLEKIRGSVPEGAAYLGSESADGVVVISPNEEYRSTLAKGGELGGSDEFEAAVPDADNAVAVLFLNANTEFVDSMSSQAPPEVVENLKPLQALGLAGWLEDGVGHSKLRITTD